MAIVTPVRLAGPLVTLEPLTRAHVDALWAAQDADTWTWTIDHPRSREDMAEIVDRALAAMDAGRELCWVTTDSRTGQVLGSTRFLNPSERDRRVEIGWTWIGPAARGTAVNRAAKTLQLDHAFGPLGLVRVELKTDARNLRSQRAMEKLGATREGCFRRYQLTQGGVFRDTVWFSILPDEWARARG